MKKLVVALMCMCAMVVDSARADNDRPIDVSQLPQQAQQFLSTHFADAKILLATIETGLFEKGYEVRMVGGQKVEFDRNGEWSEVDCQQSAVPAAIIPDFIAKYVAETWPGTVVVKIENDKRRREYEVDLSNRLELKFNYNGVLVEIDD